MKQENTASTPRWLYPLLTNFDLQSITRSITVDEPLDNASVMMKYVKPLLSKTEAGQKKIRLLGISISGSKIKNPGSKPVNSFSCLSGIFKKSATCVKRAKIIPNDAKVEDATASRCPSVLW